MESPAFTQAWTTATSSPLSFDAWEAVLRVASKEPVIVLRRGFDAFLERFPLCYGYWNQYALAEAAQTEDPTGAHTNAKAVFERAAEAVPHSVDNWVNYTAYLQSKDETPEVIRAVYDRGLALTQLNKQAEALWTAYADFEMTKGTPASAAVVFKRALGVPATYLDAIWAKFSEFALPRSFEELATPDEGTKFGGDNAKVALLKSWEDTYKANKAEGAKREGFEAAIVQHFYLARPLDDASLNAWRMYLEFEKQNGDADRVEALFGRCLIVCANYAEFWELLADWRGRGGDHKAAADALLPAVKTFIPNRPDVHLRRARELELAGDTDGARAAYTQLLDSDAGKGLVQAAVKFSSFERRAGGVAAGAAALENAYKAASGNAKAYLLLQWAHYLEHVSKDVDAARAAYDAALAPDVCGASVTLWQAYTAFVRRHPGADGGAAAVTAALKAGLACDALDKGGKEELWLRYLDHVEATVDTVAEVQAAEDEYKAWVARTAEAEAEDSKKRSAAEGLESSAKMARTAANGAAGGVAGAGAGAGAGAVAGAGAGMAAMGAANGAAGFDYTQQYYAQYYGGAQPGAGYY